MGYDAATAGGLDPFLAADWVMEQKGLGIIVN
jgi:hypothetical protein